MDLRYAGCRIEAHQPDKRSDVDHLLASWQNSVKEFECACLKGRAKLRQSGIDRVVADDTERMLAPHDFLGRGV